MNNADPRYPSPGAPKTRTTDEPRLFEVQSDEDLFRSSAPLRAYDESFPDGPRAYVRKELEGLPGYFAGEPGVCEMTRLFVLPEERGRGVGEQLVAGAVRAARALQYKIAAERLRKAIALL